MTRDEVVALLDRFAVAITASDASRVPSLYTRDATVLSPMFGAVVGHSEIAETFTETSQIYADISTTLEARVVEGDRAVEVRTVHARHIGEAFGVPASNKQISFTMVFVFDLRDGLVAQERRLYDFTSVLIQLGVLRAKPV
ncbi:MAG TPA: nuclear transport factor 2 family protein [Vicinamibacterales bacterium]|nr:nuclear transport factor 2 family protein [Vicinamibacterales bacterium]